MKHQSEFLGEKKQKQFDQIKPIEVVGHAPSNAFTS